MKYLIYQLKNNEKFALYLIVVFTLILKSVYVFATYYYIGTKEWGDDSFYLSLGEHIASGNWTDQPNGEAYLNVAPVIPFLIALFVRLFKDPIIPFYVYSLLATVLLIPVLFYLGKEMFNTKIGWLLALWGGVNLEFIKYIPHLLKEPTLYLLIPLTILLLIKFVKSKNQIYYLILSAISFTLLMHTDERYFFYFPFFTLIFLLKRPILLQKRFRSMVIWVGLVFLLMLPWGIRNYIVFGQVVIISSRTTSYTSKIWGKDISGFDYIKKNEGSVPISEIVLNDRDKLLENQIKKSNELSGLGLYFKTFINIWQPCFFKAKYVKYCWWEKARLQKWSFRHNFISLAFYGVFLPFYVIGLILLSIKFNPLGLFIGSIPILHSLLHSYMVMPEERYRYPIVFIVVMIGSWTVTKLYENVKNIMVKEI
ncbi:MAG: glycosyltransferase family 39 protein [Bacteroidales bacterium]